MKEPAPHTILVVDDDESVLYALYNQLAGQGWSVIPTTSPAEAVHLLRTREVALLICDLRMPGTDGNAVLSAARAANPDTVSVLISGSPDQDSLIHAVNEGGLWKFLQKPWRNEELLELVRSGIERYARLRRPALQLPDAPAPAPRRTTAPPAQAEGVQRPVLVVRKPKPVRPAAQRGTTARRGSAPDAFDSARYQLGEVLGEGRIGRVYRAQDTLLDMTVAVKVLSPELSRNDAAIRVFKEEARIAMQLSHRHIVRLHNLVRAPETYFLVMEYVPGRNLHDVLASYGRLALPSVLQILTVAADALSYAHRHGVLHRDLKPSNIMLSDDGVLKIIDFGIACLRDHQPPSGAVLGTPGYMSPEQLRGQALDERADIYSLGAVVCELLTGIPPIPPGSRDNPQSPAAALEADPRLPACAIASLKQAMDPDPRKRWPSISAFEAAMTGVCSESRAAGREPVQTPTGAA